MESIIIWV